MEMQGVTGAPYSHPITKRKIPAPFVRPSIHSTIKPVKRYWKEISILDVKKGDTVAEFGVVEGSVEFINTVPLDDVQDSRQWRIRLYNKVGEFKDFPGHQRVYAFTAEDTNG